MAGKRAVHWVSQMAEWWAKKRVAHLGLWKVVMTDGWTVDYWGCLTVGLRAAMTAGWTDQLLVAHWAERWADW